MADRDCHRFADPVRTLGADHPAAGASTGDRRNLGAQCGDCLVPHASAAHNARAAPATATGSERLSQDHGAIGGSGVPNAPPAARPAMVPGSLRVLVSAPAPTSVR